MGIFGGRKNLSRRGLLRWGTILAQFIPNGPPLIKNPQKIGSFFLLVEMRVGGKGFLYQKFFQILRGFLKIPGEGGF